jgi:hydrogenase expression/formation protein HypE
MSLPKGKLKLPELERLVFPLLPRIEDPTTVTLDYGTTTVHGNLVVSTDPVIGIPLQFYGFFAVHYSATDVAMAGATPQYLALGIYYPPDMEETWLTDTLKQLGREAEKLKLQIMGGHTGGYDGLQVPLIATTCFGILPSEPPQLTKISPGDVIIAVGPIGRETLWFVANVEPSHVDSILPRSQRESIAKDLTVFSVVPVVQSLAKEQILLMHDLAEGGLGLALTELFTTTGRGITIQYENVPWDKLGIRLFNYLNWNPMYCSSFGSFLIITKSESADEIIKTIKKSGRNSDIIGTFTRRKRIIVEYPDGTKPLEPGTDPYQRFTSRVS